MTSYPEAVPTDITHYVGVLRSQWRPIIVGAALGLLAATGFLAFTGTSYTATTDLNINVISTDPFNAQRSASGLLDGKTESQIASSYVVATRAAEQLEGAVTAEELREGSEISTVAEATIIRISFTADSADGARAGADAIADAYLSYRATQARERLGGVVNRIEERLAALREELTDANNRAASSQPGTREANQAASDRELITIEIDSLLEEKNALDLINTTGGSVLSTASENPLVSAPRIAPVLATGLLAGLTLGIIAAFIIDSVHRKLSSLKDVERVTRTPVLTRLTSRDATIPPMGSSLDEFRTARERLFAALEPNWTVITLFDLSSSANPSDVPVGLALAVAQDGQPTRLVLPGITDELSALLVRQLSLSRVSSGPAGSSYSTPDGLFTLYAPQSANPDAAPDGLITDFVRDAAASADPEELVIIALPKNAPHSSALAAGRLADAMAIMVTIGTTHVSEITAILEESALGDTHFVGTIAVPDGRRILSADSVA